MIFANSHRGGQVTIFMVLGVVLLLGAILFFTIGGGLKLFSESFSDEAVIRRNVVSCLDAQLNNALVLSALRGGPIYDVSNKFVTTTDMIEYYYAQPFLTIPKLDSISADIDKYIYVHMNECFSNTSALYAMGYDLMDLKDGFGIITFKNSSVEYEANLSFSVNVSGKTYTYEQLVAKSSMPYLQMYDYASNVAYNYYTDPQHVNFESTSGTLQMSIFMFDEQNILHVIRDGSNEGPSFMFAASVFSNIAPVIEPVGAQDATLSTPLELQIRASDYDDEYYEYSTTTQDVILNPVTGELLFMPAQSGVYFIDVVVTDARKSSSSIRFEVRVDE